ncbi:MAG: hypothetical protein HQL90_07425 [Magnetococcales bacterium]|nr:hypothetical protein [Magnetococcales bacterium]
MSRSSSHWPDEMRLSRWWLTLIAAALAGRDAFESLVVGGVLLACWPDEMRLSRWWLWLNTLVLFPVLAGRRAFESQVVGVVSQRDGRTRCV